MKKENKYMIICDHGESYSYRTLKQVRDHAKKMTDGECEYVLIYKLFKKIGWSKV